MEESLPCFGVKVNARGQQCDNLRHCRQLEAFWPPKIRVQTKKHTLNLHQGLIHLDLLAISGVAADAY